MAKFGDKEFSLGETDPGRFFSETKTISMKDRSIKLSKIYPERTISGRYNLRDAHDQLIPCTVRSPAELALLCLEALGEKKYIIDLPSGMTIEQIENKDKCFWVPQSYLRINNPCISWNETPAEAALMELVSIYEGQIIYDSKNDRVLVLRKRSQPKRVQEIPNDAFVELVLTDSKKRLSGRVTGYGFPDEYYVTIRVSKEMVKVIPRNQYIVLDASKFLCMEEDQFSRNGVPVAKDETGDFVEIPFITELSEGKIPIAEATEFILAEGEDEPTIIEPPKPQE
jgi:hypothetical protein